MPHLITPDNFNLLKFNFGMLNFYGNVWAIFFSPFILFLIIFWRRYLIASLQNKFVICITVILLAMSMLCFFYQWPESRFTFYLWPWFLLLFFSTVKVKNSKVALFLSLLLIVNCIYAPSNYWQPQITSLSYVNNTNWVMGYFQATSTDRKISCKGEDCLAQNIFLKNSDDYVNRSVRLRQSLIEK
jgi:hypothetical protein